MTRTIRACGRLPGTFVITLFAAILLAGCGDNGADVQRAADTGIEQLRDALRANPDDAAVRLRIARRYLAEGDGAAAESHLRRAQKLGASDAQLAGDIVLSMLLQKRHFEALETVEAMLADAPSARLWMLRGEAQLGLASYDPKEIRRSFLEAFRDLDANPDAGTQAQLGALARSEQVVAAAKAHVDCHNLAATPITPAAAAATPARRVLQVGPGRRLATPSQAAAEAQDGDLIEIDAGQYNGDVAIWRHNDLTLRGVGGIARLEAAGKIAADKAIWVFDGDRITAENIAFSGAKVRHQNGAGIRLQGTGVTIRNCHFHDNENGILGGNDPENDVLVEFSTFERNGYGDGQSHNMYIGRARSFTLRYSYSHASHIGHLVKSRAHQNAILFNRLIDGSEGDGSYVINIPDGGRTYIVGNEMQQGPRSENPIFISVAEESSKRENQALFVVNNTFYNHVLNGTYVRNASDIDAVIANNLFAGAPAILLRGPGSDYTNLRRPGAWLVSAADYDFSLTAAAPAIDAGTDPTAIEGLRFLPLAEYVHPAQGRTRLNVAQIDIGAHEFCGYPDEVAAE